MTKSEMKWFMVWTIAIALLFAVGGYWLTKMQEIRTEQIKIEQAAETERTEENAQFWQKLVPWGEDEAEQSE